MFKMVVAAVAAVCLAMPAMAWKDGEYKGQGEGKSGMVKVKVVVSGGKIASVVVTRHGDTDALMDAAKAAVCPEIVKKNSVDVAGVGGATLSSEGIKKAVSEALAKAK